MVIVDAKELFCIESSQSSCTFRESGSVCPNFDSDLRKRTQLLFLFRDYFSFYLLETGKYMVNEYF